MMRCHAVGFAVLSALLATAPVAMDAQPATSAPAATPILGFTPAHALAEHRLEDKFQALPTAAAERSWHREFTMAPHPPASPQNNRLAEVVAREWRKQGWESVLLRRYDVLHSSPRHVALEMVAPVSYRAALAEAPYAVDPDSRNPALANTYFGYSASGDVTAELVYAHNGNPEDYDL